MRLDAHSDSVPLVDGTRGHARIELGRLAQRTRERLERDLDDVVQVLALVQVHVQVALRAAHEALEEHLAQLACRTCRASPWACGTFHTKNGRPDRSTAQVTSASSIGSVAEP